MLASAASPRRASSSFTARSRRGTEVASIFHEHWRRGRRGHLECLLSQRSSEPAPLVPLRPAFEHPCTGITFGFLSSRPREMDQSQSRRIDDPQKDRVSVGTPREQLHPPGTRQRTTKMPNGLRAQLLRRDAVPHGQFRPDREIGERGQRVLSRKLPQQFSPYRASLLGSEISEHPWIAEVDCGIAAPCPSQPEFPVDRVSIAEPRDFCIGARRRTLKVASARVLYELFR
jgi:hypothetical protein